MGKRVVVIASGETERRALPRLAAHLRDMGVEVVDVRIPPNNRALDVGMAEKLIKSVWYESHPTTPDKLVVLADTDGKAPHVALEPFRERLPQRLDADIKTRVLYAYAKWHLEAWFFGDAQNLRGYVGGSLGSVDVSKPDEIENPKEHLKNLLDERVYTARVSEEIASALNPRVIAQRSPSFKEFLDAVVNGEVTETTAD